VDGFQVEGMTQDEFDPLLGAEIGQLVPGEDGLNGDYQILAKGFDGF
jgi:hypothetical protein